MNITTTDTTVKYIYHVSCTYPTESGLLSFMTTELICNEEFTTMAHVAKAAEYLSKSSGHKGLGILSFSLLRKEQ